jgi:hypothetical protein
LLYTTTTANTGALTLAVNGASAAAVQKWLGTALASGDLKANEPAMMTFDGTNWQLGTIGNSPAGSSFTLTTTGISGLATYAGGVLNIPNYSGGGGGNVSSTGTFSTPNDVPTIAGSNTIQDPTGVTITNSTLHASNTFVGPASSYSNATTSLTTVLTSPTIAAGTAVAIHCWGMYSFTTAAEFAELGITTSQTPVSIAYSGLFGYSLVTNTGTAGTTGNGTSSGAIIKSTIITAALSTPYSFQLDGVIVWNASTPGTFALGAATSSTSGTINVGANQAYCTILP